MKNRYNKISFTIIAILLFAGLMLGTFFDIQIAQSIFNSSNLLGNVFGAIGKMPSFILGSFAFLILFECSRKKHTSNKFWRLFLTSIYFLLGILVCAMAFLDVFELFFSESKLLLYIASILAGLFIFNAAFLRCEKIRLQEFERYKKWAIYCIFTILAIAVVNLLLKNIWGRARYLDYVNGNSEFSPWYLLQKVGGSSFPSGHTMMSCGMFLLIPITRLNPKLKGNEFFVLLIASVFVIITMLSRLCGGYHYLSDVFFGAIMSFVIIFISNILFWGKKGVNLQFKKNSFWDNF